MDPTNRPESISTATTAANDKVGDHNDASTSDSIGDPSAPSELEATEIDGNKDVVVGAHSSAKSGTLSSGIGLPGSDEQPDTSAISVPTVPLVDASGAPLPVLAESVVSMSSPTEEQQGRESGNLLQA